MNKSLVALACVPVVLAGCGGGGSSASTDGVYQAYTMAGRHFPITFNFSGLTYSYTLDGTAFGGTLTASGESFSMIPSNSSGVATYAASVRVGDNVLVGSLPVSSTATDAFIAAKNFVTNLADVDGARFETISRDTTAGAGPSVTPARWSVLRVNAAGSTMAYCKGTPTGFAAGSEPLADPSTCPAGTVLSTLTLAAASSPGAFTQSAAGAVAGAATSEVRFARVGNNVVYMAVPSETAAVAGTVSVGLFGEQGALAGDYVYGYLSLGGLASMTLGPATNAASFQGGTVAAPGSYTSMGALIPVVGATNSARYQISGSSVPSAGIVITPTLAVKGNFSTTNGDVALFLK